jgi:hypothetical protein
MLASLTPKYNTRPKVSKEKIKLGPKSLFFK